MKNGDKVRDRITGFEGTLTGWCSYITGCEQGLVQPVVKDGGEFVDARWFDEDRLEVIKTDAQRLTVTKAGPDATAPIK